MPRTLLKPFTPPAGTPAVFTIAFVNLNVRAQMDLFAFAVDTAVREAVLGGLTTALSNGYRYAVDKAPVRKVFRGGRRKFLKYERFSAAEKEAERITRRNAGIPEGTVPIGRVVYRGRKDPYRRSARLRQASVASQIFRVKRGDEFYTARGIGEIQAMATNSRTVRTDDNAEFLRKQKRTGRMLTESKSTPGFRSEVEGANEEIGGHLRASMYVDPAVVSETGYRGAIGNTAAYSRFVEFGTRHAHAQPFLRPTIAHLERSYPAEVRRRLRRIGRAGG